MEPAKAAPRGIMTVKRLLETDPCPCRSGKPFAECCRAAPKEGFTPETTLHLLFEERDSADPDALCFYSVRTEKLNGKVTAEEVVASIATRLWSPNILRVLDRMEWQAVNAKGLKMTMTPELSTPAPPALLDADGNPVK